MNSSTQKRKSPPSFSEEHRRKIGAYWLGKKRNSHIPWNKGVPQTDDAREKNRIAHIGNHHTDDAKRRIGEANKGEKNIFWNGGRMESYSESEQIRKSVEYKLWRDACFARDGYTCQKTGIKGTSLIVHHIYNFADNPTLRLAIDNGITLSVVAHKAFHKKYGNNFNTPEQLKEFLENELI